MKNSSQHHKRIVFCDFDGTITRKETFVAMLRLFVPREMAEFSKKLANKEITLREGVRSVLERIPSCEYGRAVDFVRNQEVRPGFVELLRFLKKRDIPFVVISGGLMDSVKTRLEEYGDYIHSVFAPKIDTSGKYIKVVSEFEEGDELVSKVRVMSLFDFKESVVIGDGATDHNIALNASIVFARMRLGEFLKQKGKEFIPWDDFFDIKEFLEKLWDSEKPKT